MKHWPFAPPQIPGWPPVAEPSFLDYLGLLLLGPLAVAAVVTLLCMAPVYAKRVRASQNAD